MTIRERIAQYQTEVLRGDLHPTRASEILVEISALYGNVLDRMKDTEMAYNIILLDCLNGEKVANRAVIKSKITEEYQDLKDATNTEKLTLQMIRSLSKLIKAKGDELSTAKYQ